MESKHRVGEISLTPPVRQIPKVVMQRRFRNNLRPASSLVFDLVLGAGIEPARP